MKKIAVLPYLALGLAVLGIADASYVSQAIYSGQPLWCPPPVDGCNIVAGSPHARIFGVPLAYFGVVFYVYMAALAALLAFDPLSRGLRLGLALYAAAGVASTMYYMYIQLGLIRAFCVYCLISAVLTLLLLVVALSQFRASASGRAGGLVGLRA